MWERFTEHNKSVVFRAREEAVRFGSDYVTTEHLLLALCHQTEAVAARTLRKLGVDVDTLVSEIEGQLEHSESSVVSEDMAFTPRSKRVLELAVEEARLQSDSFLATQHVLLGFLVEGESLAAQALSKHGVAYDAASRAVASLVNAAPGDDSD